MTGEHTYTWLKTGDEYYSAYLAAIDSARETILLETYIFALGGPGDKVRDALTAAVRRGVKARVLIDGFGSMDLPAGYWNDFTSAGGELRIFNPLQLRRLAFRNHRKLLVCDMNEAFIGGFNITGDEAGDGITRGWRDLGLRITGPLTTELANSFDRMYEMAEFKHRLIPRLRLRLPRLFRRGKRALPPAALLLSQPGGEVSPIKNALLDDLRTARRICIISGYFLPTRRLKWILRRAAKHRHDVRIITAGRSDVMLARLAGRALYQSFLRAGIKVFEYEAQILHSKLVIADNVVYVGSSNMDIRSLNINYELLIRINDPRVAAEARAIFDSYLPNCRAIEKASWVASRGLWEKLLERLAHFILVRIDTYVARRQLSKLR